MVDRAYAVLWCAQPAKRRGTGIICTIGPKTKSVEMITELRKCGLNVVRMNFSHGSYEYHGEVIANARKSFEASVPRWLRALGLCTRFAVPRHLDCATQAVVGPRRRRSL